MIEEYREYKWYKIWIQKMICIVQKIIIIIKNKIKKLYIYIIIK